MQGLSEFIQKNSLKIDISRIFDESLITPLDFTPDSAIFSPTIDIIQLKRYEELKTFYFKEGVTYYRQKLLQGLSYKLHPVLNTTPKQIYSQLSVVANIFLFNEFEVVYWSLLLKSNIGVIVEYQKSALFAAYLAKVSLNSEILPFEAYLSTLYLNFKMDFHNWQLVCDFPTEVNLKEVNKRFYELVSAWEIKEKDYEEMVEELMPIPRRRMSIFSEGIASEYSANDCENVHVLEDYEGLVFDPIDGDDD